MEEKKHVVGQMERYEERGDKDAVVHIRHLKKSFNGKEVLRDLNLDVYRGENLVLLGRSGQGKSVMIKCIIGLLTQDNGTIRVLNKEVDKLTGKELKVLRQKIGFLFQGGAVYDSMSVEENLRFPLTRVLRLKNNREIKERVNEVLEGVGLKDTIHKMPSELSGGMRKRIALARMLILKPEVVLYDEPTTGLDPITSKEISNLIVEMRERYKTTSLIITHDMACARITADRLVVMNNGRLIAEGAYGQLEHCNNELVRAFFK
jgi:phospholipid/cholesterol/gamma-HCH transport system ATP-binding protein